MYEKISIILLPGTGVNMQVRQNSIHSQNVQCKLKTRQNIYTTLCTSAPNITAENYATWNSYTDDKNMHRTTVCMNETRQLSQYVPFPTPR